MRPHTILPAGMLLVCVSIPSIATSAVAEVLPLPSRGICAHRGASATHPENTLSALREAVRLGAHMVEFDVQLTKDGQLVLMHDATIDRTTTGSGKVSDKTLAELRQLDAGAWRDAQFAGERIPTLAEALAVMPTNIWLNVHLKGNAALAEKTAQQLQEHDRLHQALLACDHASADAATKVSPKVMVCNMDRQWTAGQYAQTTIDRRSAFIQLLRRRPDALNQIARLKEHGVRINYCCTDNEQTLRAAFAAGVDFVLVDRLKEMLDVAEGLGIEPLRPAVHVK